MKRIAFVVRDPLPPTCADLAVLFGAELPRHGIGSILIGQRDTRGALAIAASPLRDALGLWRAGRVDCIQVRDKIASGLLGRIAAALRGVPFVYWMSFPMVEGFEARRDEIGRAGRGPRWAAHALRARAARWVLYRLVLPGARHVFVQSDAMAKWLAGQGVARARMTVVPMGVDAALFERAAIAPSRDPRLDGRRVIVYLGRVAQARQSGFLLDVVDLLREGLPEILLVIAGDAPSPGEMDWMRREIDARGLADHVLLTGWLAQREALGYAVRAEVGLSPIPRGAVFDVSSPTKLVEYLALGIPSVANDIPDQALVIAQSGAGLAAPMQAGLFGAAVRALLDDPAMRARCAERGPPWVARHRSYAILGRQVAQAYAKILPQRPRVLMIGTAMGGRDGVASVLGVLRAGGLFERGGYASWPRTARGRGAPRRRLRWALCGAPPSPACANGPPWCMCIPPRAPASCASRSCCSWHARPAAAPSSTCTAPSSTCSPAARRARRCAGGSGARSNAVRWSSRCPATGPPSCAALRRPRAWSSCRMRWRCRRQWNATARSRAASCFSAAPTPAKACSSCSPRWPRWPLATRAGCTPWRCSCAAGCSNARRCTAPTGPARWSWACAFSTGTGLRADWLRSIHAHCAYIERHLSRHSSANMRDALLSKKAHTLEQFWHFAPGIDLQPRHACLRVTGRGFAMLMRFSGPPLTLELVRGSEDPPLGWFSRHYEAREPCNVLKITTLLNAVPVECRSTITFFRPTSIS